jgi:hypothetical protein
VAATAAAVVLLTSCSAAPAGTPGAVVPEAAGSEAVLVNDTGGRAAAPRVELRSRVTRIAGHLSAVRRERVARQARATVQDYLEAAFTDSGAPPFQGFQPGLRKAARADERVLVGARHTTLTRARAWFAVAAPHGRPVGVTARLRVDVASMARHARALTGRLLLTWSDGRWQVFGYDLARDAR